MEIALFKLAWSHCDLENNFACIILFHAFLIRPSEHTHLNWQLLDLKYAQKGKNPRVCRAMLYKPISQAGFMIFSFQSLFHFSFSVDTGYFCGSRKRSQELGCYGNPVGIPPKILAAMFYQDPFWPPLYLLICNTILLVWKK